MQASDYPLSLLPERLAVCRLPAEANLPDWARFGALWAAIRTRDELSIVCEERFAPPETRAERGWRAFRVEGQLEFSLVGILASITSVLADAGVSTYAISTYDTDYILVKETTLERALEALQNGGYLILTTDGPEG